MGTRRRPSLGAALFLSPAVLLGAIGFVTLPASFSHQERVFTIHAQKYAYDPAVLRVDRGDRVRLRFASTDVVHGFYLEGYDLDIKITPLRGQVEARGSGQGRDLDKLHEVVFTADRSGKFRYRCSETCGNLHPFMLGELIVAPNRLLSAGLGATVGLLIGGLLVVVGIGGDRPAGMIPLRTDGTLVAEPQQSPPMKTAESPPRRVDLLRRLPLLKWLVSRRWFQFAAVLPMLLAFLVLLAAGVFGTPVGNHNISIVFVWILWWFLLISVMVPFASRIWCALCPIPFFGEWSQRGALVGVRLVDRSKAAGPGTRVGRNRYFGWNLRWPRSLQNIWPQNIGFLVLCTFSVFLLTRPIVTAVALACFILVATALHLVYRQRAFCRYLCPVGGFLSLFSMASMLEVRSKEADVCRRCRDKGCLAGNEKGWGCPWSVYPSRLKRNNSCGLCMECIKTCPHDNMTLNLRPFCGDTDLKGYDEAWKAFIMISLVFAYTVIYQGPWGVFKDWANASESGQWAGFLIYASVLWLGAMVVVPTFHYLAVWTGRKLAGQHGARSRDIFLGFAYPLVPLGLLTWVAFSLPLVLVNGSYVLTVLSDPFGWGWDILGTADVAWRPLVPHWAPYLQTPILLTGLAFGLKTGYGNAVRLFHFPSQALRAFIPSALLLGAIVASFLILYVG